MIKNTNVKIAIASGKGGTGKTLVSTNLFYVIQQNNIKVTLVDCDAEEPNDAIFFDGVMEKLYAVNQKVPVIDGNKCTFCNKCHEYCNYNAIFSLPPSKIIKVIEDLCHGCGACVVACKFETITEKFISLGNVCRYALNEQSSIIEARTNVGVYSPVSVIKAGIREAGIEDIIILDAPPGTSCPFIQTISNADFIILVTEPTPFGLSDLKQSVEIFKIMDKKFGVIINRAGLGNNEIYNYLQKENIILLLEIPYDKNIAMIYSQGKLIAQERTEYFSIFNSLYNKIFEEHGISHY